MTTPATRYQPPATALHTSMTPLVTRHTSHVTHRRPAAFTLIELLVVIAIIAILAGLGFAGLQSAMESSKKAQARNDVNQIASAIKAYQLEYGRLPQAGNEVAAITGDNSKSVVFLEAKAARKDGEGKFKGGLADGEMYDPWGNQYEVILDDNYDNRVQHNGAEHLTTVVVETTASDGKKINNVQ